MTWSVSSCKPSIAAALERAQTGMTLSAQDAMAFEQTSSSDLLALLQVADALRAQHHGSTITYSRKVFLPLTNLCRDYCGYCTFRKDPGDPGAKTMTPDDILAIVVAPLLPCALPLPACAPLYPARWGRQKAVSRRCP
jgi:2-iminoacetate synthase ThiH